MQVVTREMLKDIELPYAIMAGAKSMLRDDELKLLFYLARDVATIGMALVDAGAFTGGSTKALAAGLDARADRSQFFRTIHSYDKFEVSSNIYKKLLFDTVELKESFFQHYLQNIEPWHSYINAYNGDFTKLKWIGMPISILFCDISKTPLLDLTIWRSFVPFMVPGQSIFIQQDFVHIHAPYLHIALGEFHEHFEFDDIIVSSLILRYKTEIDKARVKDGYQIAKSGTLEEQLDRIERLVKRIEQLGQPEASGTLELIKCMIALNHGNLDYTKNLLQDVTQEYKMVENPHFKARIQFVRERVETLSS